jgi:hypothetical protein
VVNVVIYTRDFEPITVLDLPLWLLEKMEQQGRVRVAVMRPPTWTGGEEPVKDEPYTETVVLECFRLRWSDGTQKPIIVTQDDELALALKPDWLPGQRAQVNSYKDTINFLVQQLKRAIKPNE